MRSRPREHKFVIRHQRKQQLLLRALEEMDTTGETAHESAAITEMITRLEDVLSRRQRRRLIGERVGDRERVAR